MTDLNRSLMLSLTFAGATALGAQNAPPSYAPRFDVGPYAGASIPTGAMRDTYDSAFLLGARGTYTLASHLDLLGDFDWTRPTTTLVTSDAHADVYQADLGVEVGAARGNAHRWAMRPFADIGAGVRRYNYASSELNDTSRPVGFAAVGTELAFGRSAIRLAARDNVLSYVAPTADATHSTRNDLGLTLGLDFHP